MRSAREGGSDMSDPQVTAAVTPAEATPGAPLLDVDGLTVRLPIDGIHRPVLRDVSFSLRQGEAFGLVGESGSGKSMTARAIDRLLPAGAEVKGSIRFDGRVVFFHYCQPYPGHI